MYNIIHISCSTFKHLGQGSRGFERKRKRLVCSVTKPLQQSPLTVLQDWNGDPEVHATTQAAVHCGTELQPLHSSTPAFLPASHLLQTSPATQELHFQGNAPHFGIFALGEKGKENLPVLHGFFLSTTRVHSPSSQGGEKKSSQTLLFQALELQCKQNKIPITEHPLKWSGPQAVLTATCGSPKQYRNIEGNCCTKSKLLDQMLQVFFLLKDAIVSFFESLLHIFIEKYNNNLLNTERIPNLRIRTTQCELRNVALSLVFTEFCRNQ